MSDSFETDQERHASKDRFAYRLMRLCLKELRETLRDRRTTVTLVLMPLLVYPLLALVFQKFLVTSLSTDAVSEFLMVAETEESAQKIVNLLRQADRLLAQGEGLDDVAMTLEDRGVTLEKIRLGALPRDEAIVNVGSGMLDVAILERDRGDSEGGNDRVEYELVYRPGIATSESLLNFVEGRLRFLHEHSVDQLLDRIDVTEQIPGRTCRRPLQSSQGTSFSLAALLPLILVLMTVTGAVYPAIDLTAGERERGTLEALIAAPVPRVGLLFAKYIAVLAVAVLTALMNLIGMTITAKTTGLDSVLLGGAGLSAIVAIKVLFLMILFAAFFSGVLLTLTSYARSFKEAQAYIIPLMLLCLVPGILCLVPGVELKGIVAVTPLLNIVLLARDLLEGNVDQSMGAAAIASTGFYVLGAISVAARIFGTDFIIYGSQGTWSDFWRQTANRRTAVSPEIAVGTLAILFPCYFVASGLVAGDANRAIEWRLALSGMMTVLLFGCLPLLVVSTMRLKLNDVLLLRKPMLAGLAGAILLGLSLWTFAFEIGVMQEAIGIRTIDLDKVAVVREMVEAWKQVSPWIILAALALAPGICEELFFRGFLMNALMPKWSPWKAILISSVLFGVFHVVAATMLAPERFLPSTFLGIVLGWVAYQTGTVFPGMVLHSLHNGFLLMVARYEDRIEGLGVGNTAAEHLPLLWLLGAAVAVGIAVMLVKQAGSVVSLDHTTEIEPEGA